MLKSLLLCIFLFVNHLHAKECGDDCITYNSCPKAAELALSKSNPEKFKNSFCGHDYSGYRKVPKICCSDFSTEDRLAAQSTSSDLENHPNARLLPDLCGDMSGKGIFGGKIASLYEFPWMTLISHNTRIGKQFKCGGSIINSRYILTAAHCADKTNKIAGVRIGVYDIRYPIDCQGEGDQYTCESHIQDMLVEEIIVHEDYKGPPRFINDIALLRLKKPIDFSHKNAGPICLPITSAMRNESLGGRKGTVAGWGLKENDEDASVLLKVDIPILTSSQCAYNRDTLPGYDTRTDKQLCAGGFNKDTCHGDSGGPLMLESTYDGAYRIVQYGIVSYGPRECGSSIPDIYTDVTKFMDWILNKIKE